MVKQIDPDGQVQEVYYFDNSGKVCIFMVMDGNITVEEFVNEAEKLKPIVHGYGKEIAEKSGVTLRMFYHAREGKLKNPIKLRAILREMKKVAKRIEAEHNGI